MMTAAVWSWLMENWIAVAPMVWLALSAVFNVLTRQRTVEEWVALGETYPRTAGLIRLVRALGVDPVKALIAFGQFLRGKVGK